MIFENSCTVCRDARLTRSRAMRCLLSNFCRSLSFCISFPCNAGFTSDKHRALHGFQLYFIELHLNLNPLQSAPKMLIYSMSKLGQYRLDGGRSASAFVVLSCVIDIGRRCPFNSGSSHDLWGSFWLLSLILFYSSSSAPGRQDSFRHIILAYIQCRRRPFDPGSSHAVETQFFFCVLAQLCSTQRAGHVPFLPKHRTARWRMARRPPGMVCALLASCRSCKDNHPYIPTCLFSVNS